MSKAFTKESDESPDELILPQRTQLPPGVKNYMTSDGAQQMREELERLTQVERPAVAAKGDANDADRKRELQKIDAWIRHLSECLQSAEVVNMASQTGNTVRFGATVRVRQNDGSESTYRIVGVDEMDLDRNWVSWISPVAKALLNRKVGDIVKFRTPMGEEKLTMISINYVSE